MTLTLDGTTLITGIVIVTLVVGCFLVWKLQNRDFTDRLAEIGENEWNWHHTFLEESKAATQEPWDTYDILERAQVHSMQQGDRDINWDKVWKRFEEAEVSLRNTTGERNS